jgi:hypothetical protein
VIVIIREDSRGDALPGDRNHIVTKKTKSTAGKHGEIVKIISNSDQNTTDPDVVQFFLLKRSR